MTAKVGTGASSPNSEVSLRLPPHIKVWPLRSGTPKYRPSMTKSAKYSRKYGQVQRQYSKDHRLTGTNC